jgi:FAD/FMN-containing dehydrogenase
MNRFKGEIEKDPAVLQAHATDASVFKVVPLAVMYPKNVSEVIEAVKMVAEEKKSNPEISLSVRAGGTCMSGGSLNTGYILNMTKYMNKVEIDPEHFTATVEMGAYFRDIESEAAKHGLMFAPYTSSHLICGIGGMIGNNASGEKSIRYGATIDNVLSLEVVLADGSVIHPGPEHTTDLIDDQKEGQSTALYNIYREYGAMLERAIGEVPKAASGYRLERVVKDDVFNMTPIFIGAQGTLGIVTKATLKLVPLPPFTRLLLISVDSLHDMPFILERVMKHNPEGVETFDINTYNRAKLHMQVDTDLIDHAVHSSTSALILAQFAEGSQEESDLQARNCMQELDVHKISYEFVDNAEVAAAAWRIRRVGYSVMRDYNEAGFRAVPCIEDIIVPISRFDVFIEELIKIMKQHDINYGYHGHIGDGALRIIPVFNFNDPEVARKIISFTRDVFVLVKKVKGNMSADHSDGIIRSPFLREFYGEEIYNAFEQIKQLFDPEGLFNPRKKVGAGEDMIHQWLDR